MTLQEALEVTLPSGKPLASATLFDIYEFGTLLGSLMVDPNKLERAADDDPIWEKATVNAELLERYNEAMEAMQILHSHNYRFPADDRVLQ